MRARMHAHAKTTTYLSSKYFRLHTIFVREAFFLGCLTPPSNVDAPCLKKWQAHPRS